MAWFEHSIPTRRSCSRPADTTSQDFCEFVLPRDVDHNNPLVAVVADLGCLRNSCAVRKDRERSL